MRLIHLWWALKSVTPDDIYFGRRGISGTHDFIIDLSRRR